MDILFRLRLLIWVLVLGLWAHITYQFVMDEGPVPEQRMHWLGNPFPKPSLPQPTIIPPEEATTSAGTFSGQMKTSVPVASSVPLAAAQPLATAAPSGSFIKPIPPAGMSSRTPVVRHHPAGGASVRRHEYGSLPDDTSVPEGFFRVRTRHFVVLSEAEEPPQRFLETLENLHGNLMLDLAAFSPWANDEQVTIYLFRTQDMYRQVTKRPAWSGGASSVSRRTIYLYESDEMIGILAHEMTHIYFDGFFAGGHNDPLWLSEGLATVVQVERGLSTPNWLPENLDVLSRGGGFRFSDLMRVNSTAGANDDNVRLWYTESYSVVRFLLRIQGHASFFHFCSYLKEGQTVHEALYHAYGNPYNRVNALETAWRYDLKTRQLTGLRAAPL